VGATTLALAALEVAVRRRRRALARRELVGVHAQAHRAARRAPLGPGRGEDLVQALLLGLEPHAHRARHDEHAHTVGDLAAVDDPGDGAQVLDAPVGAGPDEHGVDADVAQRGARGKTHVGQRLLGGDALVLVDDQLGIGNAPGQRQALPGVGAPRDERGERVGVDVHLGVEHRIVVGGETPPLGDRRVEVDRRVVAAPQVLERRGVLERSCPRGARLDGHVADRHPRFERSSR
jgi:hypothetical protein